MNLPLLPFNLAVAAIAILVSYHHDEARIDETRLIDPRSSVFESNLQRQREDAIALRHKLRTLDLDVHCELSNARYLLQCRPLRDWQAKASRLQSVIPLFRAENARVRGIDVQNILSFRHDWSMALEDPGAEIGFTIPPELVRYESEHQTLRTAIQRANTSWEAGTK
jgi:hypothetical protein